MREAGTAIMSLGADCPLVCLYDSTGPAVALLHAGWRGIVAGVLQRGMEVLAPARPEKVEAFLGACGGPCCYEVGEEVAGRFPEETLRRDRARATVKLDLPRAVEIGLGRRVTRIGPGCTICGGAAFSHRATGTPHRHALIAALHTDRIP